MLNLPSASYVSNLRFHIRGSRALRRSTLRTTAPHVSRSRWASPSNLSSSALEIYLLTESTPQNAPNVSEDCLFLNIIRPKGVKQGQKLPVMVYIHGGGFMGESSRAHYSVPIELNSKLLSHQEGRTEHIYDGSGIVSRSIARVCNIIHPLIGFVNLLDS